jgi:hypothetical protein
MNKTGPILIVEDRSIVSILRSVRWQSAGCNLFRRHATVKARLHQAMGGEPPVFILLDLNTKGEWIGSLAPAQNKPNEFSYSGYR